MRRLKFRLLILAGAALLVSQSLANGNHNAYLRARLQEAVQKYGVPAMQAAVWTHGGIQARAVYGRRRLDSDSPARLTDAFHIGSITKPITSTLICRMSDLGLLPGGLETTLESTHSAFFEPENPEQYRVTTLLDLMSHVDGMHYQPLTEPSDEYASFGIKNLRKRRRLYVNDAIKDEPYGDIGTYRVYAGGHIVAASMLEQLTGKEWEDLVQQYVFDTLHMDSAGFGPTSSTSRISGIWEHSWSNGEMHVRQFPANYRYEPHAPAGRNVHATMEDLCRFGASHLNYGSGIAPILTESSENILRTVYYPDAINLEGNVAPMTPAWIPGNMRVSGVKKDMFWHNGDNGFNYAFLTVAPEVGTGYVSAVATNVSSFETQPDGTLEGPGPGGPPVDDVRHAAVALEERYNMIGDLSSNQTFGHTAKTTGLGANPNYAIDNNYSTAATITVDNGLVVDLGTTTLVKSFHVGQAFPREITAFTIEYRNSPAEPWHVAYTGTKPEDDSWKSFGSKLARYWQLRINGAGKDGIVKIQEFWLK